MRHLVAFLTAVLAATIPSAAQDGSWKKALERELETRYTLTEMDRGFFAGPAALKDTGIELTVQKRGLISTNGRGLVARRTRIRNGEPVTSQSDAGTNFYIYKVGERVYVRDIEVDDGDVTFSLITVDSIERVGGNGNHNRGNTTQSRYFAVVSFEFEKPFLQTATMQDIVKAVSPVLSTDDEVTSAKTIELGQSLVDVEKILGKPENVVKLGAKIIYAYKNMRVVFVDGKVADVQ